MASARTLLVTMLALAAITLAGILTYFPSGTTWHLQLMLCWLTLFLGATFLVLGVGGLVFAGTCTYYEGFAACSGDAGFSALTLVWGIMWTYYVLKYIYMPLNGGTASTEDSEPLWPSDSVAH